MRAQKERIKELDDLIRNAQEKMETIFAEHSESSE